MKKGLHVTAARPAQPALWTAKLDRFKGSKHHTALITCHRAGPAGPDSRWVAPPLEMGSEEGGLAGGAAHCVHTPMEQAQEQTPPRKQHKADVALIHSATVCPATCQVQ